MAEHLTNRFPKIGVLMLSLLAAMPSLAATLVDPTVPPAVVAGDASAGDKAQPVPSGPVLQSVLISPTRVVAIINGQTVKVGDKYGEARVVRIAEGEVVLRNGNQLQTLKLFPDIEKLPASRTVGVKPDVQRKTHN